MTRMWSKVANAVRDRDCALRLGAEWSPELDEVPIEFRLPAGRSYAARDC